MMEIFDHKLSSFEVCQKLELRKKAKNETVDDYIAILEEIASQADIPGSYLVSCIVEALQDYSHDAMILNAVRTMRDLLEVMQIYVQKKTKRNLMAAQTIRLVQYQTSE